MLPFWFYWLPIMTWWAAEAAAAVGRDRMAGGKDGIHLLIGQADRLR
jgi:hypothetical protein